MDFDELIEVYKNFGRDEYLREVASQSGLGLDAVRSLYFELGPDEKFDAFLSIVEDYSQTW